MRLKMFISTLLLALSSTSTTANELIINNVTLISAERSAPLEHANVRINDDRIIEVSLKPIKPGKSTTIINGKGKYLTPGLMDSHVHVSSMPGALIEDDGLSPLMKKLQAQFHQQQPRSYLYFGVTQLLDPSQSKAALTRFDQHDIKPDLFHCGAVPILKGYPTIWSSEEAVHRTFAYLLNPEDPEHTPEAVVARMANDGAKCVKVFIEDGFGSNSDWPLMSNDNLKRIKSAANKHGLMVFAHANAIDMQKLAVDLGVDTIAHGMWNWNQHDGKPGLPSEIKSILDKVIADKVTYQPTFNVMDGIKGVTVKGVLNDSLYKKVIPQEIMDWYHTADGQWFSQEMVNGFGGNRKHAHTVQDMIISQGERVVQYLYQQGHPLVLASDTPSSPTYAAQPGYSTYTEIKHMAKVGVSLKAIFAAATLNNAKSYGLIEDYGTVEPGKIANLLLLEQNPLETVEAYNSIDKVILHGKVIERETLTAN